MKTVLFLITLLATNIIYSQQSFVDSSFGSNGFVAGKLPGVINSVIQQPGGKILAAGSFELQYSIARFLGDGTLDSSFGENGYTISNPAGGASEMLLTKNKKILIVGGFVDKDNVLQSFVSRFTLNGFADSSFGVNGTTVIPKFHRADGYSEIALNEDGSIIVGGYGTNSVITLDSQYSIISKLSPDGVFDNTFGSNGYVLNLTPLNMKDLAIQPDGKIVTCGTNMGYDFVFSRYNTNGSLDTNFGNKGNVVLIVGGDDEAEKIIMLPSNKIIIGGFTSLDGSKMCALRLNSNGSLDETFGDSGKVLINFQNNENWAYDMVEQPDGKFILAGGARNLKQTRASFALSRITNDGKLDSSFGINGLQTTTYSDFAQAYCATLQSDGKIILGGMYQTGDKNPSYLIARYNNEYNKKQIIINKIKHYIETHNNIQASTLNKVYIYPNPATNNLHIEGLSSSQKIKLTVVDIAGNIKLQAVANASSYNLNISTLQAGNYLLKIEMNDEIITKQFVKE